MASQFQLGSIMRPGFVYLAITPSTLSHPPAPRQYEVVRQEQAGPAERLQQPLRYPARNLCVEHGQLGPMCRGPDMVGRVVAEVVAEPVEHTVERVVGAFVGIGAVLVTAVV